MICADVLTVVKLTYFHNILTVYLLFSPLQQYRDWFGFFSLFWIQIELFSDRMKESV